MIPIAKALPEKSDMSPLMLKKAAQHATNKADKATIIIKSIITIIANK
jgi:hypothetical protein